jgi:GTP-binding protein EngB required for normal cell division
MEKQHAILIIWTKIDQLNQSEKSQLKKKILSFSDPSLTHVTLHEHDEDGLNKVRQWITSQVR